MQIKYNWHTFALCSLCHISRNSYHRYSIKTNKRRDETHFSPRGVLLRKYISVNLGWWHNLKNASEKLWQRFSLSVFAPLFHSLYPASRFPIKSRGPQDALIHFLYLAGAYRQRSPGTKETVRDKLAKLLLRAEEPHSPIDKQGVYHLYNLKFLLEYAIPSVPPPCLS